MTFGTIPSRFLAAALLGGLLLCSPAFADEPAGKDFVRRLSDAERQRLERSATWDGLSAERKQTIARAVIRMRDMTDAERTRFSDRIRRYQAARKEGGETTDLPERIRDFRTHGKRKHRQVHSLSRGAAEAALARLSDQRRKSLSRWGVVRGHEIAFFRMLLESAAKPYASGAAFDLTRVPEKERAHLERMIERADERKRGRIAYMYVSKLAATALDGAVRPLPPGRRGESPAERDPAHQQLVRGYYKKIGEQLAGLFPEAFAEVVARVEALEDREAARTLFRRYDKPLHRGRGRDPQRTIGMAVWVLLDAPSLADTDAQRARVAAHADALLRFILVEKVKVPTEQVDRVLGIEDVRQRRSAVQDLLREHGVAGGRGGGRQAGGPQGRGDGRRGVRR